MKTQLRSLHNSVCEINSIEMKYVVQGRIQGGSKGSMCSILLARSHRTPMILDSILNDKNGNDYNYKKFWTVPSLRMRTIECGVCNSQS